IALIAYFVFGVDPQQIMGSGLVQGTQEPGKMGAPTDEEGAFVSQITGSTEDVWTGEFREAGRDYRPPTTVLYEQGTATGCGFGASAMGPFYCPNDQRIYLDLSFFRQLESDFGAPGEFARAYVIAHEVGHHVQTLLGQSEQVRRAQAAAGSEAEANSYSVRLELQADCYAGVWARQSNDTRQWLDPGDVEAGMRAASAVGDDTLQRRTQGRVAPDSFTHGSSDQRVRWFTIGLQSGDPDSCDTFGASRL
ncbi:MAG TPA: neutral zinc metallopeptidase, partial [Gemmatimonadales bacterium]|nr:neutral zinc metallopeptidase [Gemmatimonadales bacterium]